MVEESQYFCLDIDTYVPLLHNAEALVSWVTTVYNQIITPIWSDIASQFPGKSSAHLHAPLAEGYRAALFVANEKNWNRLMGDIKAQRLSMFRLYLTLLDEYDSPSGDAMNLICEFEGLSEFGVANRVWLSIPWDWVAEDSINEFQEKCVKLAKSATLQFNAVTGYISLGRSASSSAYERYIKISYPDAARRFRSRVRGNEWGNFLSAEHIATLRGIERIRAEAPCAIIEDISDHNGAKMYLQLTEDISNISADQLEALKLYFEPLLPTRVPFKPITS